MSKPVKIRILKAEGFCRDTTVDKVYQGTYFSEGEKFDGVHWLNDMTAQANTVVFTDDIGDKVEAFVSSGLYQIVSG